MPNLAIIVAVSEYANEPDLPACRHDGNAVAELLKRTGRFDEVLHLSGNNETVSSAVKTRLSALADQYRGQHVSEVVFYFSGHGDFDGQDFKYVLSDYNNKKPSQTTLSNSELDGIIRNLAPELFVKVVDACHSGISYIKGDDDFSTYLKGSRAGFGSVYFMFSSQSDEASYASEHVSFFTRSILKAVSDAPDGPVRYRDLMSAASDEFALSGSGQTPKFVIQANNTEIFCETNDSVRDVLSSYLKGLTPQISSPAVASTLIERIRSDESNFCTQDEAESILEQVADQILDATISEEMDELFEIQMHREPGIAPQGHAIGTWLEDNADRGFFAKPTRKMENYVERVPKGGLAQLMSTQNLLGMGYDEDAWRTINKTRQVVDSYRITTDLPFSHLLIELEPKLKALTPFRCLVAPIISRTHVVFFWRYMALDYSDWEKTITKATSKWTRAECLLKDQATIDGTIKEIWDGLHEFVMTPLLERWPDPKQSTESEDTENADDPK